jgi:hypothetical protein
MTIVVKQQHHFIFFLFKLENGTDEVSCSSVIYLSFASDFKPLA